SPTWPSYRDIWNANGTLYYSPYFTSDIGFTSDQIINASLYVKNYIESNHQLPSSVNISGIMVNMPQFLRISTRFVTNEYYGIDDTFILGDFGSVPNHIENITTDDFIDEEYIYLAQEITAYMDITRTAPSYISNTSLGDSISFESLVYMYSKVLVSYNSNNQTLPDSVSIIPWIAVSNPNKVYNFRTQKLFDNIQSAIDDLDTHSDDTIFLGKGNYLENVIINKRININSLNGNVTVSALNPNLPIFTINAPGNGSSIQNMLINGSISSMGVYINNSFNNTISHNAFTLNMNGIYLYNSRDNEISSNIIFNNTLNGISVYLGGNNTFSENNLTYNNNAILLNNTCETTICQNIISKNTIAGINSENSSADINFNMISQNGIYGLHNLGNSSLDALNNWWGSNNPVVSLNGSSDIYNSEGTLNYDKWIVMNINSSCDRSNRTSDCYNYIITADLTHDNQGNDTSGEGNIPDGVPVNFVTNIGTIVSTGYTKDGKAKSYLNSKSQGFANISAMLDNQTNCTNVNVTSVNILSIYNNRTHEGFTTIQGAINDNDTIDGDIITLGDGTYIENVIVNKNITVTSLNGSFVTINAADSSLAVFNITGAGNGSTIKGLSIMGSDYFGIFLDSVNNCNIVENIFTKNSFGIYLNSANNNNLTNNKLIDNYYGIDLFNSNVNSLSGNYLAENYYGIYFDNSNNNSIIGNILHQNWYGIQLSNSSYNNLLNNEFDGHWLGTHIYVSNNTSIINNTVAENYVGISYYDSEVIFSFNNFTENEIADISQINSSEIVASENLYDCGPAALATLMKSMGLNVTTDELSLLAGTDYDGTSMYGLIQAANAKGLNATGVLLPVDQLVNNSLIILSDNGKNHYCIFRDCINNTVHLIDPSLGNIEMSYYEFCDLYGGKSVIFTNEIPVNGAIMDLNDLKNTKGSVVFLAVLAAPAAYSALTYVAAAAVGAAAGYVSYQAYKHYKNPPKKTHTHVNKYAKIYSPKNVRHYSKNYRNPTKGGKNYGDKNNKKNQEYERKKQEEAEKKFLKAVKDAYNDPIAADRLGRIPSSGKDPISKKYKIIAASIISATIGGFMAKDYLVYLYKKNVLDRTKSYIDIDRTKLIIDIDRN
ncbi:MAG: right-handed parallel beta-helix repeat-containing protein, partial [Methanobacteriaceae archaeon]|nr:right-handed parallel beta-helix repeat-containing protein [Methanobacteriaceae archaeon]